MPLSLAGKTPRSRLGTGSLLKGLIWLFCVGLIAISWFVALGQIRFEREQAVAEAIAQNENRAIAFEQYVRRTLEVATIATRYVAERFRRGDAGAEFLGTREQPAVLRGNLARTGTFIGIAIVNAQGDLIATSRPGARPINVAQYDAFRVHIDRDSDQLYVSRPFRSPVLGRDVILLTRRLNNPDGSFGGVVSLIILPEQFTAFYRNARFGPYDIISLIGLDGIARARRVGNTSSSGEDMRGLPVMRVQMQNPNGTSLGPSPRDGLVRYFSHRRLEGYPLFVTYGVLESEVLASPRHRARVLLSMLALGTLAVLGFAIALTVLINRGDRRALEIEAENIRLEDAQRLGEMGDWRYDVTTRETYWSPQTYALHERDPALGPIPRDEYRALLDDAGRAAIDAAAEGAFKTRQDQEFEIRLRLPSGREIWHWVSATPLLDAQGRVTGLRGTSQNITQHKQLEQLQTRVAYLSRLDAMNAMASTLAHELNQPLAAAVNYLAGSRRVLSTAPAVVAEATEGMVAAEQQIHFAAGIIRRLREMVANQPRKLASFTLETAVDDAIALIETGIGAPRPAVTRKLGSGGGRVRADRVQVQQVLINLLRNAIEATRGRAGAEIVVASDSAEGGMIRVSVSDNGPGFSQPPAERFSPFAAEGDGMGLGLSISRTIVESHGGRIWTEDRGGGGAVVLFTLPAARETATNRNAPNPV
jgi:C4-dicarboxylate-specific signal transduction histidine kinase